MPRLRLFLTLRRILMGGRVPASRIPVLMRSDRWKRRRLIRHLPWFRPHRFKSLISVDQRTRKTKLRIWISGPVCGRSMRRLPRTLLAADLNLSQHPLLLLLRLLPQRTPRRIHSGILPLQLVRCWNLRRRRSCFQPLQRAPRRWHAIPLLLPQLLLQGHRRRLPRPQQSGFRRHRQARRRGQKMLPLRPVLRRRRSTLRLQRVPISPGRPPARKEQQQIRHLRPINLV
mmetsp:Transcript_22446/g.64480  ORF Transcript_22446/g.64480 Transcript_22446/m.64480 type:complete len:229 (+) Transcript_22446:2634-3320(+)